jgi:hypothetical protein
MIYAAWVAKGRPPLRWRILEELAKTFYPDQFANAKSVKREPSQPRIRTDSPETGRSRHRHSPGGWYHDGLSSMEKSDINASSSPTRAMMQCAPQSRQEAKGGS